MGLNTWQRKEIIKQRLMTEGRVAVSELSRKLSVSAVTIRHDLAELSREGFLVRTYGGAIRKEGAISPEYSFLAKSRQHSQEKKMIAAAAARLIQPGQIIFLDTGTTTLEIARQLATVNFDLTVVTTSLPVVSTLIANSAIRLLVIGGFVRRPLADLSGPGTVSQLAQMSFQQCFLGVDGLSSRAGLTTTDAETAALEESVLDRSEVINIVADASKIGRISLLPYGNIFRRPALKRLITDRTADRKELTSLRQAGFVIILCSGGKQ